MSAYYEPSQWPPTGQPGWDHQTPPPARSGANSAIPREEPQAFAHQLEEVDRAIDNLVKSGKMFAYPGARHARPPAIPGARPHPIPEFDPRAPHPAASLQNFYAAQRHQPSRGSNEAEQMMQAKRRMAAQRERELRNYHQEQQYNRTVLAGMPYGPDKPDRTMSPGGMSEEERRKLIAQQRSALYGEGPFGESGGYVDESGAPRPGLPGPQAGPAGLRGHSPLAYDYGRAPPVHPDAAAQASSAEGGQGAQSAGPNERSRANSNSSPQSNPPAGGKGMFDSPAAVQQSSRTSASSPGGSPPRQSAPGAPGSGKPSQTTVAPIGTRPSVTSAPTNPALNKRSTTPLPSPLSQGYTASSGNEEGANTGNNNANSSSAGTETPNVGLAGWGARSNGWGSKSGLGTQASVWG